jgi:hypothetical protein
MAPSAEQLRDIANQAEADLNTYEAKTGAGKTSVNDEAGVDSRVETKFPGAEVKYGQDLSTNAGFNKRIPPEEGGELDARGRQTRGEHFEGKGGPEDKLAQQLDRAGGYDNAHELSARQPAGEAGARADTVPEHAGRDLATEGKEAARANAALAEQAGGKTQFKGSDYYRPESVPDSISAEGYIPPASVTQASREAENP